MIKLNKTQRWVATQKLTKKLMTSLADSPDYSRTNSCDVIELLDKVGYDELGKIILEILDQDGELMEEITSDVYDKYADYNELDVFLNAR